MTATHIANSRDLPIALFDSGVGGLTVFRAISELMPNENLLYLGDTARVPYGTKSPDTIARYTLNAAAKLAGEGIKMLVVACNTATSAALPLLQERLKPMPVAGVVEPGAAAATAVTANGSIAVIATEATIAGQAYQRAINRLLPGARVLARACTLFVALAEEGWVEGPVAEAAAREYLGDIFCEKENGFCPDTLLLGCTHFPLLEQTLRKIVGSATTIVDSARATAKSVRERLARAGLSRPAGAPPRYRFLTTDNPERFARAGGRFLARPLAATDVELVDL